MVAVRGKRSSKRLAVERNVAKQQDKLEEERHRVLKRLFQAALVHANCVLDKEQDEQVQDHQDQHQRSHQRQDQHHHHQPQQHSQQPQQQPQQQPRQQQQQQQDRSKDKVLTLEALCDNFLTALCVNKEKNQTSKQILSKLTHSRRKRVCGYIFSSDEIVYSCRNCETDSTCGTCRECFAMSNHNGHDVYFQRTTAGSSCDCGDPESWKRSGFCSRHAGVDVNERSFSMKHKLPKHLAATAPMVIDTVMNYLHELLLFLLYSIEAADAMELFTRDIPAEILTEMESDKAVMHLDGHGDRAHARETSRRSSSSVASRSSSSNPGSIQQVSTGDASSMTPSASSSYAIRLHNDGIHTFAEAVSNLCAALGFPKSTARSAVNAADQVGEYILERRSLLKCCGVVSALVRKTINVSVMPAWMEKQFDRIKCLLEWLHSLSVASDGLAEIVSESIRKDRSPFLKSIEQMRMAPSKIPEDFLSVHGAHFNRHFLEVLRTMVRDEHLSCWMEQYDAIQQTNFSFAFGTMGGSQANLSIYGDANGHPLRCPNPMIEELIAQVTSTAAFERHVCVREGVRRVVKEHFQTTDSMVFLSVLDGLMRADFILKKSAADMSHMLLRSHLLHNSFRLSMIEAYLRNYIYTTQFFVRGLGNSSESIFDFAVQMLTIPSLVKRYTKTEVLKHPERPNLVKELLVALKFVLQASMEPRPTSCMDGREQCVNVDKPAIYRQKYKHCLDNLEYVLNNNRGIPNELVCDDDNLLLWLNCLKDLENADPQKRRGIHESHVEYESETWLTMFNLGIRLHSIFPVAWQCFGPVELNKRAKTLRDVFTPIASNVIEVSRAINSKLYVKKVASVATIPLVNHLASVPWEVLCYEFNVSRQATSLHLPLHRFFAAGVRHIAHYQSAFFEQLTLHGLVDIVGMDNRSQEDWLELLELPLRSLVMGSQIHANMWRRNGDENMLAQLYNYSALPYCVHYRDSDIFILQLGVLGVGPQPILARMMDHFQLCSYFTCVASGQEDEAAKRLGYGLLELGIDAAQMLQLVEEFLRLIIILGTSLPSAAGAAYEEAFLEEEMLQHLCARPGQFSALLDLAILPSGQDNISTERLEHVLSRVADFVPPTGLEPGRYELQPDLLMKYNPYFLHMSREHHELARDRWTSYRKERRKKHLEDKTRPVKEPLAPLQELRPPLTCLRPVRRILTCEDSMMVVRSIIWKVLKSGDSGGENAGSQHPMYGQVSDAIISTCLHLLVHAIYAAVSDQEESFWQRVCKTMGAFDNLPLCVLLVRLMNKKSELLDDEQSETLEWIIFKVKHFSQEARELMNLDVLRMQAKQNAMKDSAHSGGSGSDSTDAKTSMEKRKEEARKRALEAMARQQAAFQAMMDKEEAEAAENMSDEEDLSVGADMATARSSRLWTNDGDEEEEAKTDESVGSQRGRKRGNAWDTPDSEASSSTNKRARSQEEDAATHNCILCHDSATPDEMGMVAFVHQSTVLSGAFRPYPDEALNEKGEKIREQIHDLIEKMELCSGGNTTSMGLVSSPTVRGFSPPFPDWYVDAPSLEEALATEQMLPPAARGMARRTGTPVFLDLDRRNQTAGQENDTRDVMTAANRMGEEARRMESVGSMLERVVNGDFDDEMVMLNDPRMDHRVVAIFGDSPDQDANASRTRDAGERPAENAQERDNEITARIMVRRRGAGGATGTLGTLTAHFNSDDEDEGDEDFEDQMRFSRSPRRFHHRHMEVSKLFLTPCGLHIRTCHHAVHMHCLERYINSLHDKAIHGEDFDGVQAIDPDSAMTQFLCPLCKTLCNFLIPTFRPSVDTQEIVSFCEQMEHSSDSQQVTSRSRSPSTSKPRASHWSSIVQEQMQGANWFRSVLGQSEGHLEEVVPEVHDLWRDYFEETLWEPHGSLEKGAPFLWSACAFTVASFLGLVEEEFRNVSASDVPFNPLVDACPQTFEKDLASLSAVTKFCRWSFSLLEHSSDAKVILETAKRCNPIHCESKREYRKFTKVIGSIDACLRGTILGFLVADSFTAFVISSVIADKASTIMRYIPVFCVADLLQRLHQEFFEVASVDKNVFGQDKYTLFEQEAVLEAQRQIMELEEHKQPSHDEDAPRTPSLRSTRSGSAAAGSDAESSSVVNSSASTPTKQALSITADHADASTGSATSEAASLSGCVANLEDLTSQMEASGEADTEEFAALQVLLKLLHKQEVTSVANVKRHHFSKSVFLARIRKMLKLNAILFRRMRLFWCCLAGKSAQVSRFLDKPGFHSLLETDEAVFDQLWKWCQDRNNSRHHLGVIKNGDKCEHTEGCSEAYIANMFILRDLSTKPQLIDLPIQFDELYSRFVGKKCRRCKRVPEEAGICLVCGELLCCGVTCCTRPFISEGPPVGECTRHAAECGGGVGIVFLFDQCRVAIIGGSMAAHFPSPYVDSHGEEDVGLQRGRPLRLDMARYRYLESLWLNDRVFTEVSRLRNQKEPQYTINLSFL